MIAIVTDSTAYLTKKEAKDLGVTLAPITYTVAGRIYNETYADANGNFEKLIAQNYAHCQTSHTNIAVFMSSFEALLRQNKDILCITISSRLSGNYSSAAIAAREMKSDRIVIVDSLTTAAGLHFLVERARELANAGLSIHEIAGQLEQMRDKISIAFSVDDMEPLRRSGRLGLVRQSISTILNIKPLLICQDGAIVSDGIVRGKMEQIRSLVKKVPDTACRITVQYIGDQQVARSVKDTLAKSFPAEQIELRQAGPVLQIHLGLGAVGVAWLEG